MAALALLAAAVATNWISWKAALIWLAFELTTLGLAFWLTRKFLDIAEALPHAGRWRSLFIVVEALQGTTWAAIAWLLGTSGDPIAQSFVLVLFSLAAAMTATISASIPAAVKGAVTPMTLATLAFLSSPSLSGVSAHIRSNPTRNIQTTSMPAASIS